MSSQNIVVIKYGNFEQEYLDLVIKKVADEFGLTVTVKEGKINVNEFYNPIRRQYDGDKLLKEVETRYSYQSTKSIGLFQVDIFTPILTYIFGQAYLNGNAAIVSLNRLKNERYGLKPDIKLLYDRFSKIVIHELGHTFGLKHCINPVCVMRSGTYVEDLDQKNSIICQKCRRLINLS